MDYTVFLIDIEENFVCRGKEEEEADVDEFETEISGFEFVYIQQSGARVVCSRLSISGGLLL